MLTTSERMSSPSPSAAPSFSSSPHPSSSNGRPSDALRADLGAPNEQDASFIAKADSDAFKVAKDTTAEVAGQVGAKASDLASVAAGPVKTFASELERIARVNPLSALAGALLMGVRLGRRS